jgi:DNA-binding ferritin-like protein
LALELGGVDDENMKSKVEFTDEELAQIAELVRENFEVYGYDPDSHTDRMLQSIFKKITGSEWCKQG